MTVRNHSNGLFGIPAWVMPLISIITMLVMLGVHWGLVQSQLSEHEEHILELQDRAVQGATDRLNIETRLTRIETDIAYIRMTLERMEKDAVQQRVNP